MIDDFESGAMVRLKSGGPIMTVHSSIPHSGDVFSASWSDVTCIWFDKNDDLQQSTFKSNELEKEE